MTAGRAGLRGATPPEPDRLLDGPFDEGSPRHRVAEPRRHDGQRMGHWHSGDPVIGVDVPGQASAGRDLVAPGCGRYRDRLGELPVRGVAGETRSGLGLAVASALRAASVRVGPVASRCRGPRTRRLPPRAFMLLMLCSRRPRDLRRCGCHRDCHSRRATGRNWPQSTATVVIGPRAWKLLKTHAMRAIDDENCQSRGRGFKSRRARHKIKHFDGESTRPARWRVARSLENSIFTSALDLRTRGDRRPRSRERKRGGPVGPAQGRRDRGRGTLSRIGGTNCSCVELQAASESKRAC